MSNPKGRPKRAIRAASPVVRHFFEIVGERQISFLDLTARCRFSDNLLSRWGQGKQSPTIDNFEEAAAAIGMKVVLVPIEPSNDPA